MFGAKFFVVLVLILFANSTLQDAVKYEEASLIPDTNLYSGVWYTISLKKNGARLTWINKKVSTGDKRDDNYYHIEIVDGESLQCYYWQKGQKYFNNVQWMFLKSNRRGYYLMRTRNIPEYPVTYSFGRSSANAESRWVAYYLGPDTNDYEKGGKFYDSQLWKIQKTSNEDTFIFTNFRFGKEGIMTFSNNDADDKDRKYVQLEVRKGENVVATKGENPEYSWSIDPAKFQVEKKQIPGTSLFTGIQYTIDLVGNGGRLTWSTKLIEINNKEYRHTEIVKDELKKEKYLKGGSHYKHARWMILEGGKGKFGFGSKYKLVNMGAPNGGITAAGSAPSGPWVLLDFFGYENPVYWEGGKNYSSSNWQFLAVDFEDNSIEGGRYYNIINEAFPKGLLTYTTLSPGKDSNYVEVLVDGDNQNKYVNDPDYYWDFNPAYVQEYEA